MKKCPFCAEEIQEEAIKCKHCGEFLDEKAEKVAAGKKGPWYFRVSFIVIAVACVGPLALPLIWWRPRTSMVYKIVWTVIILVLSWYAIKISIHSFQVLKEYYQLPSTF